MPITAAERAAQKHAWSVANREKINERRRCLYASGYKVVLSERGKADRCVCVVCGKERRRAYMARHMATKHPSTDDVE